MGVDELVVSLAFPGLPVEQPKKGYTFDGGRCRRHGEPRRRRREAGVGSVVYISGAGAGHDADRHWFRAKARRRGRRARLGHGLDHHPTDLGLRPR